MSTRGTDALLRVVADRRRRQALRHLRDEVDGRTTVRDLADRLWDLDNTDEGSTDRKRLAVQLYHVHLPKLADHAVVEFDPEGGTVRYRPNDRIEAALDSFPAERSLASP